MKAVFIRRSLAARRRGWPALVGFWFRALGEVPLTAARLRIADRAAPRPSTSSSSDGLMSEFWSDVTAATRAFLRRPAVPVAIVGILALAIGASTAMFSVVNGVLLRPLPFPEPDRLVRLAGTNVERNTVIGSVNPEDVKDWGAERGVLAHVAAHRSTTRILTGSGDAVRLQGRRVTAEFFDVLGVRVALGRTFTEAEEVYGRDRVVVLSHGLWTRRFGGDPSVVGTAIRLNDIPFTVVGVMPRSRYQYPSGDDEFWIPFAIDPASWQYGRGPSFVTAVGRLAPGVSMAEAQAVLDVVMQRLAGAYPQTNDWRGVQVSSLQESIVGGSRPMLLILGGAVSFVLLIGCISVANLLLARANDRRREFAVRSALGAGRVRILRQVLTEGLVLSGAAAVAGVVLARWGTAALLGVAEGAIPRQAEVGVDLTAFGFAAVLALVTGLFFGAAPAARAAGLDLASILKNAGNAVGASRAVQRLRAGFVVTEIALSVVLLIGAGLLLQSLWRLSRVDPGFDPENLVVFSVAPPAARYPGFESAMRYYDTVLERARALPGVTVATASDHMPVSGANWTDGFAITGIATPPGEDGPLARIRRVFPGYFQALGVPVERGRAILATDDETAENVVVVNRVLADRFFDGEDPVGRTIVFFDQPRRVVGVVGDVYHEDLATPPDPGLYFPYRQIPGEGATIMIKSSSDPEPLMGFMRTEVRGIDPDVAIGGLSTVRDRLDEAAALPRFRAALLGSLAGLALVLSIFGIYSVVTYSVSQRRREIGIRMALGSRRGAVRWLVVREGLMLASVAALVGAGGAYVVTRLLAAFLYGISTTDPFTFVAVPSILIGVAVVASYLPARRAARIDPMLALRGD